jgi:ACS family tartrate transporter-like MFS transporter
LTTLSIAAFGIWGTLGPFWAMPTALLRGTAAAGGIALVNSIGNIGGFAGPYLMGWIRQASGGFSAGLLTLAAILIAGAAISRSASRQRNGNDCLDVPFQPGLDIHQFISTK